jgi:hypothetical protein
MFGKKMKAALTAGLLSGFAGKGVLEDTQKIGDVTNKTTKSKGDGTAYHDEWWAGEQTSAGQELLTIKAGNKHRVYSRVYAGWHASGAELRSLDTSEEQLKGFLLLALRELGTRTRLDSGCGFKNTGYVDWYYAYKIVKNDVQAGISLGQETISYKKKVVHVHYFITNGIH